MPGAMPEVAPSPDFVANLERGASEETVVRAIVMMGQSLGKLITAEGIETAEQLARLKQAGCRSGQGFFLSPRLAAEDVEQLLERTLSQAAALSPRDSVFALVD